MKLVSIFYFILIASLQIANAGPPSIPILAKTPIEIKSISEHNYEMQLSALVFGATTESQVVIFLKYSDRPGFNVATNEFGEPIQPTTINKLPPISSTQLNKLPSQWNVIFYNNRKWGRLENIYAIVCTSIERENWSRSRDYRGFSYLPFSNAKDINETLDILKDFGWLPTGLTQVTP